MQKIIVIPARGGSKGIPKKNIFPLNGKPLIEYTLDVIQLAGLTDVDVAVSTDSEEIKEVVKKYNDVYIIDRPPEISGDFAKTESALIHATDYLERFLNKKYDAVVTLQATSPFRRPDTLIDFINTYEKNKNEFDAMLSLNENFTDYWIKSEEGVFGRLFPNAPRRRQERKPLYVENSAYYITDTNSLRKNNSVLGTKINGYIISDIEAIDINEPIDILYAESIMKKIEEGLINGWNDN